MDMKKQVKGNIVDIYSRRIYPGIVHIEDEKILFIEECHDEKFECYILPGFIDAHVHIESSMLVPSEFSKLIIQKGTVAIINDPHEIANVLGMDGIHFMLENSKETSIKIFFTIPSCVPATNFDHSGSCLNSSDVEQLIQSEQFIGLSEMMNVPGVLSRDPETLRKIEIVRCQQKTIDGHAPGLRGEDLINYIQEGITTDHESICLDEAIEKITHGMKILIREGSAVRNYEILKSLIATHPNHVMFCTDDLHPDDIIRYGHIDKIVRTAISDGFDLFDVLKIACINPIQHYHLNVGTLREGENADFIVVRDLKSFETLSVYIAGSEKLKFERAVSNHKMVSEIALNKFDRDFISIKDLRKPLTGFQYCIGVKEGEIVTSKESFVLDIPTINFESDIENDILKIVYLNRYQNKIPQIAYIHGIGLKRGAFASSISHDSHNIIAVGVTDSELLKSINAVIEQKGGLSVVEGDKITVLPLPIAGIMTDRSGHEVADIWTKLIDELHQMGCILSLPFMTLSFMALIVIPELKIGERGLFEYSKFNFISEC